MPVLLNDMPLERSNRLFLHPIHQEAFGALVQLIADLRGCRAYTDYYGFQQELLRRILQVQEHRAACTRVAKRLRTGRRVPADAPDLRSGDNAGDPESWELEADACERVDRQLRSVGDALAWRVFSYDRRVIVALSRNQPPGPMAGKAGMASERDFVAEWSENEDYFVLLHDLTSCLRIGDATLFKSVGEQYEAYLYEIKSDPDRRRSPQLRRKKLAEESIRLLSARLWARTPRSTSVRAARTWSSCCSASAADRCCPSRPRCSPTIRRTSSVLAAPCQGLGGVRPAALGMLASGDTPRAWSWSIVRYGLPPGASEPPDSAEWRALRERIFMCSSG